MTLRWGEGVLTGKKGRPTFTPRKSRLLIIASRQKKLISFKTHFLPECESDHETAKFLKDYIRDQNVSLPQVSLVTEMFRKKQRPTAVENLVAFSNLLAPVPITEDAPSSGMGIITVSGVYQSQEDFEGKALQFSNSINELVGTFA